MTTWRDISVQQATAARRLVGEDVVRPSTSRAYYAAYAAATHMLHSQGVRRFGARGNPAHADLPSLILHTLKGLDSATRRSIATNIRRLRIQREDADYRPHRPIDAKSRLRAIWEMERALTGLGVMP